MNGDDYFTPIYLHPSILLSTFDHNHSYLFDVEEKRIILYRVWLFLILQFFHLLQNIKDGGRGRRKRKQGEGEK